MENWSVDESSKSAKIDRIRAEKDIEQRLSVINKVTAISIEKLEGRAGPSYLLYLKVGRIEESDQNQRIKLVAVLNENYLSVPFCNYVSDYTLLSWIDENNGSIALRETEGCPLVLKDLYNEHRNKLISKGTLYPL